MFKSNYKPGNSKAVYLIVGYCLLVLFAWVMDSLQGGRPSNWSLMLALLTLPWSVTLIPFAWTIMHDGIRSLFLLLVIYTVINSLIIYRLFRKPTED